MSMGSILPTMKRIWPVAGINYHWHPENWIQWTLTPDCQGHTVCNDTKHCIKCRGFEQVDYFSKKALDSLKDSIEEFREIWVTRAGQEPDFTDITETAELDTMARLICTVMSSAGDTRKAISHYGYVDLAEAELVKQAKDGHLKDIMVQGLLFPEKDGTLSLMFKGMHDLGNVLYEAYAVTNWKKELGNLAHQEKVADCVECVLAMSLLSERFPDRMAWLADADTLRSLKQWMAGELLNFSQDGLRNT